TGNWVDFPTPLGAPNQGGNFTTASPFWNGFSSDASDGQAGVGNFLTGTGDFTNPGFPGAGNSPQIPAANLQYWGIAQTGGFDPTELFSTPSRVGATFTLTIAGHAPNNSLGYYDSLGAHVLWTGNVGQPTTVTFSPVGPTFGLFLEYVDPSNSSNNLN